MQRYLAIRRTYPARVPSADPKPPPRPGKPIGTITRGTTNPNRLRRVDRWLIASYAGLLSSVDNPLVIDLGYGASPITTIELAERLRQQVRTDINVLGLEIDRTRVAQAQSAVRRGLGFGSGGFELAGRRPHVVRAFNVLRQYSLDEAAAAWQQITGLLAPGGVLIEGTSDEIGRRASWVLLTAGGPQTLTLACDTGDIARPSNLAERLPKALIHHNVPGQPIHALLRDFDTAWATAAPMSTFGSRERWVQACKLVAPQWSVKGGKHRWRYGELTVPWSSVAPIAGQDPR